MCFLCLDFASYLLPIPPLERNVGLDHTMIRESARDQTKQNGQTLEEHQWTLSVLDIKVDRY